MPYPSDPRILWICLRIRRLRDLKRLFGTDWQGADFNPLARTYTPVAQIPKFIPVHLSEQFLDAYEDGKLAMPVPITSATMPVHSAAPVGTFRITAYHRLHENSLYDLADSDTPILMH